MQTGEDLSGGSSGTHGRHLPTLIVRKNQKQKQWPQDVIASGMDTIPIAPPTKCLQMPLMTGNFLLQGKLLFLKMLNYRRIRRRPGHFFTQLRVDPGMFGLEGVDMGCGASGKCGTALG